MEYKGLTELDKEIPKRGKYAKIGIQAISEFQNKNAKTAKLDITYTNQQELKALYNALKSLIRRRKLPIKVSMHKDKTTNRQEIYLIQETP
jgi:hypothetical protein